MATGTFRLGSVAPHTGHLSRLLLMSERVGTGSRSIGRPLGKASTESQRAIIDSSYEEPTGPSPKCCKAADKPKLVVAEVQAENDRNTMGNLRNPDIHEGAMTVPHRVKKVAGQVGSLGTRLSQVLAPLTASPMVGDQAHLAQAIVQGTTQITMYGGTGGNGGNGLNRGIGGGGAVLIFRSTIFPEPKSSLIPQRPTAKSTRELTTSEKM